jgi:hypothetical protein
MTRQKSFKRLVRARMKAFWRERVGVLKAVLEG